MKHGTLESLRAEANAKYFAQLGEKRAMEALGLRGDTDRQKAMLEEVRKRMRWYVTAKRSSPDRPTRA